MKTIGSNAKAGEARALRNIKSGVQYDHLFEKAPGNVFTIKKDAGLTDTVQFMPKVIERTKDQTKRFAESIKGRTIYETCKNIWEFVYGHIQYRKDEKGYEQIRSPRRTWHDKKQGVDCDCYSVFISSVLTNLGIPHILRITKYKENYFQHIYPIVPLSNGKHITIDCVTDQFDYEVAFSEKKDYPMDLQYLDGFDDDFNSLGKVKRSIASKRPKISKKKKKSASPGGAPKNKKKGGFLKKIVSKINKINPATILLRNGLLAAMKLNVKNVAARLRWSYLTPEQAAAKGVDAAKYQKLVAVRQKLENIFSVGGGKVSNLKKAILKGKGNKDKAVNGLGELPDNSINYVSQYTPLDQLLGQEIYYSENVEGMEEFNGFGELGEPLTLTTVAAAMGVIAGIVASLKQIGDIFGGKGKGSEDFDESKTDSPDNNVNLPVKAEAQNESAATNSPGNDNSLYNNGSFSTDNSTNNPENSTVQEETEDTGENNLPATIKKDVLTISEKNNLRLKESNDTDASNNDKSSFWQKNKNWLKPVAIIGGSVGVIAIGLSVLKNNHTKNKSSPSHSLSGLPRRRKINHQRKTKHKHQKKQAVALL